MRILGIFLLTFLLVGDGLAMTCPSGYDAVSSTYSGTFYAKSNGSCPSGFTSYTAPSSMVFEFNGLLLDSGPTTCDADSHYVNGSCVPYTTGNCASGEYSGASDDATFYAKTNGSCPSGYSSYTAPSSLSFIFNGLLLATAPTVCASGHYVNGVCTAYSGTGCISGYVDMGSDDTFAAVDANGSCPSGYNELTSYQSCNPDTTASLCTTLCSGTLVRTGLGYCVTSCGNGLSTLRIGDSMTFPLYGSKTTTPSLVVGNTSGQCYVNMAPGNISGAVNVRYNNAVYHTTD